MPCCGLVAVPKVHSRTGTRFFAHAPYAAQSCEWKQTGELHEELVQNLSSVIMALGWAVETDVWIGRVCVDILCRHTEVEGAVAVVIETATVSQRPDDVLSAELTDLAQIDYLHSSLWVLPSNRSNMATDKFSCLFFRRGQHDNTIADITPHVRAFFQNIVDPPKQEPFIAAKAVHVAEPAKMVIKEQKSGIEGDQNWHDGRTSTGSADVRVKRLTRLAQGWLHEQARGWLNKADPETQMSPLEEASMSASGYLRVQDKLKILLAGTTKQKGLFD
jgi:hypothetical protein